MSPNRTNEIKSKERRSFKRVPVSFHVHFVPCGNNREEILNGGFSEYSYSENISTEGIQIEFKNKPNLEDYIKLQITLPKQVVKKTINVLGQVIWFQHDETDKVYKTGIKFVEIKADDKNKINDFVKKGLKL
ncbi:MAG: PilZ domain-containing protein [Candidatus Aureabacteria bacterium]|nr:PilZ domain-containing protein [Candidatus Auribacterota bacterium]